MKTILAVLLSSAISFALIRCTNADATTRNEITSEILLYKQKNLIACGTDFSSFNFGEYKPLIFSFASWSNPNVPFKILNVVSYNTLWIPDTLSGTVFNLRIHDTTKQYLSGTATNTFAFNGNAVLGPTLIFKKGTTVQMHIKNDLTDTTTVHWHGIHLPAIMDGGPHQPVAPGTIWNPTWLVTNNAATFWYHPHLHMTTSKQSVMGLSGLIIVRDDAEATLKLPRTYGVDDIPLILNDKRFNPLTNQLVISEFGDTMTCNGTLNAQYNVPAQVVRFRVLDAATDRSYNLGFSDNRNFSVIGGDAGLLNKPVAVNRYLLSPGERIEILVNLSGQQNQNVRLRAFNASLPNGVPGYEPNGPPTPLIIRNKLGAVDFDILLLNIVAPTVNPVTVIPSSLIINNTLDSTKVSITRNILMTPATGGCPGLSPACFWFNGQFYDMNRVDYRIKKDSIEIWQLINNTNIAHPFHIHDVSFLLLSKSGGTLTEYEKGWKDVVLVKPGSTVRFITKFNDYADSLHPYMYHCHISFHEDDGMMGQFVVDPPTYVMPSININNLNISEGNQGTKQMTFSVSLSKASADTVRVTYSTRDVSATSPSDYTAVNGTLIFKPGATGKTIGTMINGDATPELNETFKVILSKPENAILATGYGKGTIKNDDTAAVTIVNNPGQSLSNINSKISIYPNPSSGRISVELSAVLNTTAQLKIADVNGNILKIIMVLPNTSTYIVDISTFKTGTYFLILSNGENIYRQQFQVMHN